MWAQFICWKAYLRQKDVQKPQRKEAKIKKPIMGETKTTNKNKNENGRKIIWNKCRL